MQALKQVGFAKVFRFALMTLFSLVLKLMIVPPLRTFLLRLMGAKVGSGSVLQNVRFYNLYRTGLGGLQIGQACYLGDEVLLDLADDIHLADQVTLAARVHILTHRNVGYTDHPLQKFLPAMQKPTHIDRGAFIGANAVIMAGVHIGECAVVAAGAVVCADVEAFSVVGGVPAKEIKKLI
ncbi:MAG: DapH/DapD/GlmU-related protein [Mariprofundaceae bacterium]|nr:DapH/DapD/GlmU-related protein [Mariprofundaceae bacterium]